MFCYYEKDTYLEGSLFYHLLLQMFESSAGMVVNIIIFDNFASFFNA